MLIIVKILHTIKMFLELKKNFKEILFKKAKYFMKGGIMTWLQELENTLWHFH